MLEAGPSYYEKYITLLTENGGLDDLAFFLKYLETLNLEEYKELLKAIFVDDIYPQLIQKHKKEISTLSYFCDFFSSGSVSTLGLLNEALYEITYAAVLDENHLVVEKSIELTAFMETGLTSEFLINFIVLNPNFKKVTRSNAAIALSLLRSDSNAAEFWKKDTNFRSENGSFLALPRFNFLLKDQPLEAFISLVYSDKDILQIPGVLNLIEDFYYRMLNDEDSWNAIVVVHKKLPKWLVRFIKPILLNPALKKLVDFIRDNENIYVLGDNSNKKQFSKYLKRPLQPLLIPVIDDMKPFDQDYFIDFAEELGLLENNGYRLQRVAFKDYESSFGILAAKELAILLKPIQFLNQPTVTKHLGAIDHYAPIAINNFFKGPSLAGAETILLPPKNDIVKYVEVLGKFLQQRNIYTLDYNSQSFYDDFVFNELWNHLFSTSLTTKVDLQVKLSEQEIFKKMSNGQFILTTGPLFAMAKTAGFRVLLNPEDISSLILRSKDSKNESKSLLKNQFSYGLHNVLIVNREADERNEDVTKLANISYLTADYISKNIRQFATYVQKKWSQKPLVPNTQLSYESVNEALNMSYSFSSFEDSSDYFNDSSNLKLNLPDRNFQRQMFKIYQKVADERKWLIALRKDLEKLFNEVKEKLPEKNVVQIRALKIQFDFCFTNGLMRECEEIGKTLQQQMRLAS